MTAKQSSRRPQRIYRIQKRQTIWQYWRRGIFAGLVVAALGWGVYTFASDVQALGDTSAVTVGSQTIEEAYPDLPPAVARSVKSVVALQRRTSGANGVAGSGVVLNGHQVLTAGHLADDNSDTLSCDNTSVQAPGLLTAAAASNLNVRNGSAIHSSSADLALLSVKPDDNFGSLPVAQITTSAPKAGDTVFFINFQPTADGKLRNPSTAGLSDPVIFSGIVLGNSEHGLAVATGNGQSFGHGDPEILLRKGASGGAVVNDKGQLVGLSVSSQSLEANRSAVYIGNNYGVRLPTHQYQIANVQTFDSVLLSKLQTSMTACSSN